MAKDDVLHGEILPPKTVVITHREELVPQLQERFANVKVMTLADIDYAAIEALVTADNCEFITIDSLSAMMEAMEVNYDKPRAYPFISPDRQYEPIPITPEDFWRKTGEEHRSKSKPFWQTLRGKSRKRGKGRG